MASPSLPKSSSPSPKKEKRVTIWNKVQGRKVAGNAAPLERNLPQYLKTHPDCEVYNGQDKQTRVMKHKEILPYGIQARPPILTMPIAMQQNLAWQSLYLQQQQELVAAQQMAMNRHNQHAHVTSPEELATQRQRMFATQAQVQAQAAAMYASVRASAQAEARAFASAPVPPPLDVSTTGKPRFQNIPVRASPTNVPGLTVQQRSELKEIVSKPHQAAPVDGNALDAAPKVEGNTSSTNPCRDSDTTKTNIQEQQHLMMPPVAPIKAAEGSARGSAAGRPRHRKRPSISGHVKFREKTDMMDRFLDSGEHVGPKRPEWGSRMSGRGYPGAAGLTNSASFLRISHSRTFSRLNGFARDFSSEFGKRSGFGRDMSIDSFGFRSYSREPSLEVLNRKGVFTREQSMQSMEMEMNRDMSIEFGGVPLASPIRSRDPSLDLSRITDDLHASVNEYTNGTGSDHPYVTENMQARPADRGNASSMSTAVPEGSAVEAVQKQDDGTGNAKLESGEAMEAHIVASSGNSPGAVDVAATTDGGRVPMQMEQNMIQSWAQPLLSPTSGRISRSSTRMSIDDLTLHMPPAMPAGAVLYRRGLFGSIEDLQTPTHPY